MKIPQIVWMTEDEWKAKDFTKIPVIDPVFHFLQNYLHHKGLLCLSDGKRYFLNETKQGNHFFPENKEPEFPELTGKEIELWYIQSPREEDVEVLVEIKETPINEYWEMFLEYDERIEEFLNAGKDFLTICLYINFEEKEFKVDEDEDEYEFITFSKALVRCNIPNKNYQFEEFKKNKAIYEKYQEVFHEYGAIIRIGEITYLASGLNAILYALTHSFEKYEEWEEKYKKYEEIKIK